MQHHKLKSPAFLPYFYRFGTAQATRHMLDAAMNAMSQPFQRMQEPEQAAGPNSQCQSRHLASSTAAVIDHGCAVNLDLAFKTSKI